MNSDYQLMFDGWRALYFWQSLLRTGYVFRLKSISGRWVVENINWDGYGFGRVTLRRVCG